MSSNGENDMTSTKVDYHMFAKTMEFDALLVIDIKIFLLS